jgi:hypothetical protein
MILIASVLLTLSAPTPASRQAVLIARARVSHTCRLSAQVMRCWGAAGRPSVRLITSGRERTIFEF